MLDDNPEKQEYFLWRLMIGTPYQGKGFGRRAIELLIQYVRTRPAAKELLVSCGQGEGGPEGFISNWASGMTERNTAKKLV